MRQFCVIAAIVFALLLIGSAVDKLVHWGSFVLLLQRFPVIQELPAGPIAGVVVALEMCIGVALFLPSVRPEAFLFTAMLFSCFALATGVLMMLRPGSPCGCTFLLGSLPADGYHMAGDFLVAGISAVCWKRYVTLQYSSHASGKT